MNNIATALYQSLVHYAEEGQRVVKVELPPPLYEEYLNSQGMPQMMKTLKVEVLSRRDIEEPKFYTVKENA